MNEYRDMKVGTVFRPLVDFGLPLVIRRLIGLLKSSEDRAGPFRGESARGTLFICKKLIRIKRK